MKKVLPLLLLLMVFIPFSCSDDDENEFTSEYEKVWYGTDPGSIKEYGGILDLATPGNYSFTLGYFDYDNEEESGETELRDTAAEEEGTGKFVKVVTYNIDKFNISNRRLQLYVKSTEYPGETDPENPENNEDTEEPTEPEILDYYILTKSDNKMVIQYYNEESKITEGMVFTTNKIF